MLELMCVFVKGGSEITVVISKDRSHPFLAKASRHWKWTFVLLDELIGTLALLPEDGRVLLVAGSDILFHIFSTYF